MTSSYFNPAKQRTLVSGVMSALLINPDVIRQPDVDSTLARLHSPDGLNYIRSLLEGMLEDMAYATDERLVAALAIMGTSLKTAQLDTGNIAGAIRPLKSELHRAVFGGFISQMQREYGLTLQDTLDCAAHENSLGNFRNYAKAEWQLDLPEVTVEYIVNVLCPMFSPEWVKPVRNFESMLEVLSQYEAGLVTSAELLLFLQCTVHQVRALTAYTQLPPEVQAACRISAWDNSVEACANVTHSNR